MPCLVVFRFRGFALFKIFILLGKVILLLPSFEAVELSWGKLWGNYRNFQEVSLQKITQPKLLASLIRT